MDLSSKGYGRTIGLLVAMSSPIEQVEMVDNLVAMLGTDAQLDDQAVLMIRTMCPDIQHHLADDAMAREFARRFARHALIAIKIVTRKNRPKP